MRYLLDMLQAAGLGSATGIRPFLPALVTGALGRADAGVDFEGTSFAFLESPVFLAALVVGVIVTVILARSRPDDPRVLSALSGIGVGLGALLGAGSVDDRFSVWWHGLIVGGASALLASAATRSLVARARTRLDAEARTALPVYEEGSGLVLAALTVLAPPVAIVALGFFIWLLLGSRRRGREKYAGLRILR
jgi:Domain of unknown function (DUF4126)